MTRIGLGIVIIFLAVMMALGAENDAITVERGVSQTSLWPGERIHYWITLTTVPGVQIALESFDEKNMNFEPFVLISKTVESQDLGQKRMRYRFDYLLACYEIGDKHLNIPGLTFSYNRGVNLGNESPTEEMELPPLPVTTHSTLAQPFDQAWIQERILSDAPPLRPWMPTTAGLIGLALSASPLLFWVRGQVPAWRTRKQQLSRRKFLSKCAQNLDRLDRAFQTNRDEIKAHYTGLEGVAQDYVHYFWGIEAKGLTHRDLSKKFSTALGTKTQKQATSSQKDVLARLLEHGQSCRYSADPNAEWHTAFRQDVSDMKKLCAN